MTDPMRLRLVAFAPFPLRLLLGFGFVYHGYTKLFTGDGNEAFEGMLSGMGVPLSGLSAYAVGGFEFFGGILLVLGVAVRTVAALGVIEMIVAAVTVHWAAGFDFLNVAGTASDGSMQFGLPGYEVNLLYIAGFLSLLISGAGTFGLPRTRTPDEQATPTTVHAVPSSEPSHVD